MSDGQGQVIRVAIFDDVLAARREVFHIPGLLISVHGHADDVELICSGEQAPDVLCMDYAMGEGHVTGEDAIRAVRSIGFRGRILAMSSDPAANTRMIEAGANESIQQKAMLRSYLVALGAGKLGERGAVAGPTLMVLAAIAAFAAGCLLVGPLGWESRYGHHIARLDARVIDGEGITASRIDGAAVAYEQIEVWAATAESFERIATDGPQGRFRFDVAASGKRISVDTFESVHWRLAAGPSRRVRSPAEVGLEGAAGNRLVATSRRVAVGSEVSLVGRDFGENFVPTVIVDEQHRRSLGGPLVGRPVLRAGGLALLALGAALLASTWRVG